MTSFNHLVKFSGTATNQGDEIMATHATASREDWLTARKDLLSREKALSRERDAIAQARRDLPWVKIETDYVFET